MTERLNEMDKELLGENKALKAATTDGNHPTNTAMVDAAEPGTNIQFTPINGSQSAHVDNGGAGDNDEKESSPATKTNAKTTPKKRGAAISANDQPDSPSKKRSSIKPARSKAINEGTEHGAPEAMTLEKKTSASPGKPLKEEQDELNDAAEVLLAAAGPVTPKQKTKRASRGKAQANLTAGADSELNGTPGKSPADAITPSPEKKSGKPRQRAAPVAGKVGSSMAIPRSFEEAGPADRMLVSMKDEGKDWASIRRAWQTMTGQETGASTLPNRYGRIKDNMMHLTPGDDKILLEAKLDVEKAFEIEKWALISSKMAALGAAEKYSTAFLQKQVKVLEANGGLAALENTAADADDAEDEEEAGDEKIKAEEGGE